MAPVRALPAPLQLADHAVVDGVAAVRDVEEDVDLLHVLHEAARDGRALSLLVWSVDNSLVHLRLCGGRQGQQEAELGQEAEGAQHVDRDVGLSVVNSQSDGPWFNMSSGGSPAHTEPLRSKYFQLLGMSRSDDFLAISVHWTDRSGVRLMLS